MKLDFEYGQGLMSANLPDNTDIFVPGETVPDPECLPQDWDTLYGETLKSIRNPIGMKPLRELAHKGSTVVIIIPDIVKGGNQPTSHRKVAIRACIDTYNEVTGENATPFTMGGGTYARHFPYAVSFGPEHEDMVLPEFGGPMHGANEAAPIDKLLEAVKIYIIALLRLEEIDF